MDGRSIPAPAATGRERLEVDITEVAYGPSALGRTAEGQVVFVDDALPGERVEAEVASRKRNYINTRAVEVLKAAPGRVTPPCPYVPRCGGCQWQHADYETQVAMKVRVFAETMRRAAVDVPVAEVVPCDEPLRYRIRGEFHVVAPRDQGVTRLGFNKRRSYDLVAVDDCLIHHPHITEAIESIAEALSACGPHGIRALRLTTTPDRRELLWRALGAAAPPGLQAALEATLSGWLVHQDSLTLQFEGHRLDGREANPIFRVDSETFIQVNHRQAHLLYGKALEYLGDRPGHLVEGYAGYGAMSLLAGTREDERQRPSSFTLVEENKAALVLARLHARLHGVDGVNLLPGTVEARLTQLEPGEADSVILDPPRAGCHPEVLVQLARLRPGRVVYVSCDPSTLGRDLARLADKGYRPISQAVVDMFPQTYHIESVTLLLPTA
ncbi:MAG TPA: class I SAM-dependent RNA methyltransferase [Candidatus Dormibacteraeota bacterium]|nr:class I SAM-dependent RNA methyltransferase [Candidatus Dormibacteraeota bacterium]